MRSSLQIKCGVTFRSFGLPRAGAAGWLAAVCPCVHARHADKPLPDSTNASSRSSDEKDGGAVILGDFMCRLHVPHLTDERVVADHLVDEACAVRRQDSSLD